MFESQSVLCNHINFRRLRLLAAEERPERVLAFLDQYDLLVVGHTDPCLPYAYHIKSVRQACLQELERCAKIFSAVGATIMNVHPCYCCPPAMKQDLVRNRRRGDIL